MKQIEHDMVLLSKGLQNNKTGIMFTHKMTTKGGKDAYVTQVYQSPPRTEQKERDSLFVGLLAFYSGNGVRKKKA